MKLTRKGVLSLNLSTLHLFGLGESHFLVASKSKSHDASVCCVVLCYARATQSDLFYISACWLDHKTRLQTVGTDPHTTCTSPRAQCTTSHTYKRTLHISI